MRIREDEDTITRESEDIGNREPKKTMIRGYEKLRRR